MIKQVLVLFVAFCVGKNVFSQNTFINHLITTEIRTVKINDINADGKQDIIGAGEYYILWFEQMDNLTFQKHILDLNHGVFYSDIHIIDMDNDGDKDVVSAGGSVYWHENQGNDVFTRHNIALNLEQVRNIAVEDIDGDGDYDIVSLSIINDEIIWHENDGNQNFSAHMVINNFNGGSLSLDAVDLDGDGDIDILSGDLDEDKLKWFENNGNQSFTERVITHFSATYHSYSIDLDQDGDQDVLASSGSDILWYENDGNQSFTYQDIGGGYGVDVKIFAKDIDGDGDLDVLATHAVQGYFVWHENDGNQDFTEHIISAEVNSSTAFTTNSSYAADIDNDGDIDLITASEYNDCITLYENDGNQNFMQHSILQSADEPVEVITIDLDKDNDMDIVTASSDDTKVNWYENDGNQNFTTHLIATGVGAALDVIDIDGDGDLDIISSSYYGGLIKCLKNDGNQNFSEQQITTEDNSARSLKGVDIDNDTDIDIISASFNDDIIYWYENDGAQNYTQHIMNEFNDGVNCIDVIDMDMDGDIDVLFSAYYNDRIAWLENDGNANFSFQPITGSADNVNHVHAVDMDGDNDLDVISAWYGSWQGGVVWYENDGSLDFTKHHVYGTPGWPNHVSTQDFDFDGDIDLVVADQSLSWYENNGSQSFTENILEARPSHTDVTDIDGDGDFDIVCISKFANQVLWLEQTNIPVYDETNIKEITSLKIYPNPTIGIVTLAFQEKLLPKTEAAIQNLQGKNLQVPIQRFGNKITLDVSSLAKGSYIVTISNPNQNENYLILKD